MVSIEPRETQFSRYGTNLPKNKNSNLVKLRASCANDDMQKEKK